MNLYRAKCKTCGDQSYIFPDQVEAIKKDSRLALHQYCKEKLSVGSQWFCIKCDDSKKNGHDCKIIAELTGDDAKKLINIRGRESNLESMGFSLPNLY